jgi:ribose transport system substrate-binding protein
MAVFDGSVPYILPALIATGRQDKVKVVSFNGTPNVLQQIQSGNVVELDIGESADAIGYAHMDLALRILSGRPPVKVETPMRAWTKANIAQAGTPPIANKGYGRAWTRGYLKLWGRG